MMGLKGFMDRLKHRLTKNRTVKVELGESQPWKISYWMGLNWIKLDVNLSQ